MESNKRVTMKLKTPNPLFERWLTEWLDKAKAEDSKMQYCFNKALKSLKKYPLPLETGKSCKILSGFGDKLCQMLDQKLNNYNSNSTLREAEINISTNRKRNRDARSETSKKRKSVDSPKEYVPAINSGSYAILLTLYRKSLEPDFLGYMLKNDIIRNGQCLCDKSFTRPDPGTYYTAWSSMKTLLSKNLVIKKSNPAKFSLTEQGIELAAKLHTQTKKVTEVHNMKEYW